jgi:PAS domain S-box-containing protein
MRSRGATRCILRRQPMTRRPEMTDRPQADEQPFVNLRTPLDHRPLAMQMKSARPAWLRHLAAQCFAGGIGIILVTFVCFELEANTATASFAYLILIALLSLMGSLIGSFALSIVAVACLSYFFAPPMFSFRVDHPEDVLTIAAFFTTSVTIAGLSAKLRKAAEEAQASENVLVSAIPALVWSALPDGSRDFNSQRLLEFTGRSAEELAADGWIAVYHPEDRASVVDRWRASIATGERFEVEARARNAKGEYRCFLVRAEPLRDRTGTIVKWYGTSIDIEDRRRAVEALRESEEHWREVFEHNPVMYFIIDASGTVLSVNSFGAAQLGYTVGELVGQLVFNVFLPEDRELVRKNVASRLEKPGEAGTWEIRKIRKDGTIIWVRENAKAAMSARGNAEDDGRSDSEPIVLIACENITERKRVEDALRESDMYLAEAQKIGHTGSFGWRVASGCIVWSAETHRIFEFDPTIKPALDLAFQRIHPEDLASVRQALERAARDGRDWELEHRLLMPDGSVKHVRAVAHAVRDASSNLEFIGAVTDVTAMKRADEQLHEVRAELARVTRVTTVGELTAAIAHEINQPLTGVVSSGDACLRWLGGQPPNLEAARRAVERMLRDANRAGEVLNRIRAMVVKSPPQRGWLDINEIMLEVIALIRGEIQRNGISLRTELGKDVPPVLGDQVQLQQVILNLIMNAIETMSDNGRAQRDLLILSGQDASDGVLVSVQDSGPGLDQTALDRIFDAFYTTKPDGMGMGLSISRTIIEAHGGQLWATANALRGATFRFRLPTEG